MPPSLVVTFSASHAELSYLRPSKRPLPGADDAQGVVAQRKTVAFSEVVKARKTIHISDFADEEIKSCWYFSYELREMKNDARHQAKLLDQGNLLVTKRHETTGYCDRGLELFTSAGSRRRSEAKRRGYAVVLEEQELQHEEGSVDPEFIAELYASATTASRLSAIMAANC